VRRARARLRRKTAVSVERLRDATTSAALIRIWEDVVDAADRRADQPVDLRNTDGDVVLVTRDHFALRDPASAAEVARRVGLLREVDLAPESDGTSWLFFDRPRPTGDTEQRAIRGRVWLANGKLHLECNSRERADALRARLEEVCDGLVRHRAREHADPQSEALEDASSPALPSPEMEQLALEWKERHYADWIDHALPALGGARPRDAVRTAAGREAVDLLLKEMENLEQRGAGAAAFDFGTIRRQLGLA
jgi:hypothetical protein